MKTAVVTGASGFIGKALCNRLLEKGYFVYAFVNNLKKMSLYSYEKNIKMIELSMDDYDNISKFIDKKIDCFFHLSWSGAVGSEYRNFDVQAKNITNSIKILNFLKSKNVKKFIFFTSSHIARISKENHNVITCTYGSSKYAFQNIAQTFCYNNNILYNGVLFTNVFGIGDYSNRSTNIIIKKMLSNEEISLIDGDILYDWIYIDDAIEGIISVLELGKNFENYYIGNIKIKKFKDIMEDVKIATNSNSNLLYGQYVEDSYIDYSKLNTNKLYEDTGFKINTNFIETIKKTVDWRKTLI